jgi:hypothetical protein
VIEASEKGRAMAKILSITCKSCGTEISLGEYNEHESKEVHWPMAQTIKCPDPDCGEEHHYSGSDFRVFDSILPQRRVGPESLM